MKGLEDLKIPTAVANNAFSRVDTPCSRDAKKLLIECMVLSAALLVTCAENAEDRDDAETFEEVLLALGVPGYQPGK